MGAGPAAAHLIILVALASAGTVLVGAVSDGWREGNEAQVEAAHRIRNAAHEDMELVSQGFHPVRCVDDKNPPGCQGTLVDARTYGNWTNNGSRSIPLDELTVLLNGTYTSTSSLAVFQVRGATTSNLWLPGEVLEVRVDNQGDVEITLVGPHGTLAYRRP